MSYENFGKIKKVDVTNGSYLKKRKHKKTNRKSQRMIATLEGKKF